MHSEFAPFDIILSDRKGLQLQSSVTTPDTSPALVPENDHPSCSPSRLLGSIGSAVMSHNSLLLGQSLSLQTEQCLTPDDSTASATDNLPEPAQNLLEVHQLAVVGDAEGTGNLEGSVHQILLGDVQTLPIRIMDNCKFKQPDVIFSFCTSVFLFGLVFAFISCHHYLLYYVVGKNLYNFFLIFLFLII